MLEDLVARIAALPDGEPRLIGVDGVDGVGKTMFADELGDVLGSRSAEVLRVRLDSFHRPRTDRYRRGRMSAEGYFRDAFDLPAFIRSVVDPLRPGGTGVVTTAVFDYRTDAPVVGEVVRVRPGGVVIVDGVFLHRDELADVWGLSVFLRAPMAVAFARMAARDGVPADDRLLRRYRDGQRLYLAECSPEQRATVVVDHTDVTAPWVVADPAIRAMPDVQDPDAPAE